MGQTPWLNTFSVYLAMAALLHSQKDETGETTAQKRPQPLTSTYCNAPNLTVTITAQRYYFFPTGHLGYCNTNNEQKNPLGPKKHLKSTVHQNGWRDDRDLKCDSNQIFQLYISQLGSFRPCSLVVTSVFVTSSPKSYEVTTCKWCKCILRSNNSNHLTAPFTLLV